MASHYETLAEKVKDQATSGGKDVKLEDVGKDDERKKSGEASQKKQRKNQALSEKGKVGKEDVLDRAREKVPSAKEVAGKTLGSAKDAVVGITERTKELVVGKTEYEGRHWQEGEEEEKERHHDEGSGHAQEGKIGRILGAVQETLVEIAVSTKDLVFGKGKGDDLPSVEDRHAVYGLGQEEQDEHYKKQ